MRIDRDTLIKIARNTVQNRVKSNRNITCIYLTGSLLQEEPLIAGTTDIDLIFVHSTEPPVEREIIKYTDEVHIDIAHHNQGIYDQPRRLRTDPWLGSFMCADPIHLHNIQYWFEYTQASICSQFSRPENVIGRSRWFAEKARKTWSAMYERSDTTFPARMHNYWNTLEDAGNAIAVLTGHPLTERRFLLQFADRAERVGRRGLAPGLVDLFMDEVPADDDWENWINDCESSLEALYTAEKYPLRLHPNRKAYYLDVIKAFQSSQPQAALWLLMRIWTLSISSLLKNESHLPQWLDACEKLNLSVENLADRLDALDVYLDSVEEAVDDWASRHGVL